MENKPESNQDSIFNFQFTGNTGMEEQNNSTARTEYINLKCESFSKDKKSSCSNDKKKMSWNKEGEGL